MVAVAKVVICGRELLLKKGLSKGTITTVMLCSIAVSFLDAVTTPGEERCSIGCVYFWLTVLGEMAPCKEKSMVRGSMETGVY